MWRYASMTTMTARANNPPDRVALGSSSAIHEGVGTAHAGMQLGIESR